MANPMQIPKHRDCGPPSSHRQRGVVLILSMAILLVLTIVSVTGANEVLLNQQMATSQKQETKAFLAAQAGITQTIQVANQLPVKRSIAANRQPNKRFSKYIAPYETKQAIGTGTNQSNYYISRAKNKNGTVQPYYSKSTGLITFVTHGASPDGAHRNLKVQINYSVDRKTPKSPFSVGILGRKGIAQSQGTQIDSYNSKYGQYGQQVSVNGHQFTNSSAQSSRLQTNVARTCTSGGTIGLNGGSKIYGNVRSTNNITVSSGTSVYGTTHSNGQTTIYGAVYGQTIASGPVHIEKSGSVKKKVLSGGNVTDNSTVGGKVQSYGHVLFKNYASVPGNATSSSHYVTVNSAFKNQQAVINAGGAINYPTTFNSISPSPTVNYHPHLSSTQLGLPLITQIGNTQLGCKNSQSSGLFKQMYRNIQKNGSVKLTHWLQKHACKNKGCYSTTSSQVTLQDVNNSGQLTLGHKNQLTLLKTSKNLNTARSLSQLNIAGHVEILVKGNLTIGGSTAINVSSTGSMKFLITGQAQFKSGSSVNVNGPFVRNNLNNNPVPGFSIYSKYSSSGPGIVINENANSDIAAYAPHSAIKIRGSGSIYGGIAAQRISHSGSGSIHYDQYLRKIKLVHGNNSGPQPSQLRGRIMTWKQL